nr:unnamed protein product [Spirometra erinaceieuropaei]
MPEKQSAQQSPPTKMLEMLLKVEKYDAVPSQSQAAKTRNFELVSTFPAVILRLHSSSNLREVKPVEILLPTCPQTCNLSLESLYSFHLAISFSFSSFSSSSSSSSSSTTTTTTTTIVT